MSPIATGLMLSFALGFLTFPVLTVAGLTAWMAIDHIRLTREGDEMRRRIEENRARGVASIEGRRRRSAG